ncbi:DNA-binding domain of Mlu1-box binding protein MBP1, partial [Violaceomyces palustris]
VSAARYATSADPRGHLPVFEYQCNGHTIMIDRETSYVRFTGIWQALGHTKADVVRLLEASPELEPVVRKIRGGFLKIQGTWLPFDVALNLSRRTAFNIRDALVPLFG